MTAIVAGSHRSSPRPGWRMSSKTGALPLGCRGMEVRRIRLLSSEIDASHRASVEGSGGMTEAEAPRSAAAGVR